MTIANPDVKFGFWVGIGLLLAVLVWGVLNHLARRVVKHDG